MDPKELNPNDPEKVIVRPVDPNSLNPNEPEKVVVWPPKN